MNKTLNKIDRYNWQDVLNEDGFEYMEDQIGYKVYKKNGDTIYITDCDADMGFWSRDYFMAEFKLEDLSKEFNTHATERKHYTKDGTPIMFDTTIGWNHATDNYARIGEYTLFDDSGVIIKNIICDDREQVIKQDEEYMACKQ